MNTSHLRRILLRQFAPDLLLFTAQALLLTLICSLYQLPSEPVLYAVGLCLLLQAAALAVRLLRLMEDHRLRRHLLASEVRELSLLPPPRALSEWDDLALLHRLSGQLREQTERLQARQRDNLDYYTAWLHQVKTPIASLHMLLDEEDTEEHRAMQAELFHIEQYVELALSYIRLDSASHDLALRRQPLDPILREAIHKYAPLMIRRHLWLHCEPTGVYALTDEKWLLFILEQLLSNAVKYTREGGITISVTESAQLILSDTGIGISPEDLPRIFEKGFTGFNGRADKKATGLGLYLARRAAELLSARLTAESTAGQGSTFTLTLPQEQMKVE